MATETELNQQRGYVRGIEGALMSIGTTIHMHETDARGLFRAEEMHEKLGIKTDYTRLHEMYRQALKDNNSALLALHDARNDLTELLELADRNLERMDREINPDMYEEETA